MKINQYKLYFQSLKTEGAAKRMYLITDCEQNIACI